MEKFKIEKVEKVLNALHEDAKKDYLRIGKGVVKSIFRPMGPSDFKHAYLPIAKEQGEAMRQLILENNCKNVIEFGTSFGISTIYLADAVRQTGGKVVSTELLKNKGEKAIENISAAGLQNFVEVKIGDAMETLKNHSEPIDFLFLDGWKDLYLPLFQMLEPNFHPGTIIYADNMDMADTRYYGDYVRTASETYSSKLIHGGKAMLTTFAA